MTLRCFQIEAQFFLLGHATTLRRVTEPVSQDRKRDSLFGDRVRIFRVERVVLIHREVIEPRDFREHCWSAQIFQQQGVGVRASDCADCQASGTSL